MFKLLLSQISPVQISFIGRVLTKMVVMRTCSKLAPKDVEINFVKSHKRSKSSNYSRKGYK